MKMFPLLFRRPACTLACVSLVLWLGAMRGSAAELTIGLKVTSKLTFPHTPMSVTIDFAKQIRQGQHDGVLDANSIRVVNQATGQVVASARTEDFAYSDRGRVEWVIVEPDHTSWIIRFRTTATRVAAVLGAAQVVCRVVPQLSRPCQPRTVLRPPGKAVS